MLVHVLNRGRLGCATNTGQHQWGCNESFGMIILLGGSLGGRVNALLLKLVVKGVLGAGGRSWAKPPRKHAPVDLESGC